MRRIDIGFVAIERASEGRAIIPGAAFDENVVVAGYAGDGGARDQKISDRGVTGIVRPRKGRP